MSGMKNTPCRQQARKVARPDAPTLWKVMLATTMMGDQQFTASREYNASQQLSSVQEELVQQMIDEIWSRYLMQL